MLWKIEGEVITLTVVDLIWMLLQLVMLIATVMFILMVSVVVLVIFINAYREIRRKIKNWHKRD